MRLNNFIIFGFLVFLGSAPVLPNLREASEFISPLVIDLNKDGKFRLKNVQDKIYPILFDLNADRKKQLIGWISSDEGFLVFDRNENGVVDDGSELFGEYTFKEQKRPSHIRTFVNGFAAIATLDQNEDGLVNRIDSDFWRLQVWQDKNQNGISEKEELNYLHKFNIEAVDLDFDKVETSTIDLYHQGNEVRLIGQVLYDDGSSGLLADIWFQQNTYEVEGSEKPRREHMGIGCAMLLADPKCDFDEP